MNENEHHKEIYAHFGLAIYLAQVLENGLVNALLLIDFIPKNVSNIKSHIDWSREFDAFFDSRIALTMGNLIRELKKVTTIPDTLEKQLLLALERRRFLVHHYFRDNVRFFQTDEGRNKLIADLEGYGRDFSAANRALEALLTPLYAKYGITPERQAAALEAWRAEQQPDSVSS
ncbi:hypothetical protein GCM10011611_42520 [Aliidongia dinghuensis]|uniref:Uncharacterized protein n=1 Tax=Aliidongia dinghuensis TaxID=1867774 RepID=A0A8J2YY91_9PROT|nr:hypothetical protein [Aliidongia dinghuensis]GGF31914.1 hypothetical protein GCM10011611_42520 [Aliidongia dinghuensis]